MTHIKRINEGFVNKTQSNYNENLQQVKSLYELFNGKYAKKFAKTIVEDSAFIDIVSKCSLYLLSKCEGTEKKFNKNALKKCNELISRSIQEIGQGEDYADPIKINVNGKQYWADGSLALDGYEWGEDEDSFKNFNFEIGLLWFFTIANELSKKVKKEIFNRDLY